VIECAVLVVTMGSPSLPPLQAARKHAFLLEVRDVSFRLTPIPLRCVRPFILRTVSLAGSGLSPESAATADEINELLQGEVRRGGIGAWRTVVKLVSPCADGGSVDGGARCVGPHA